MGRGEISILFLFNRELNEKFYSLQIIKEAGIMLVPISNCRSSPITQVRVLIFLKRSTIPGVFRTYMPYEMEWWRKTVGSIVPISLLNTFILFEVSKRCLHKPTSNSEVKTV
jgi:hypothetical protein